MIIVIVERMELDTEKYVITHYYLSQSIQQIAINYKSSGEAMTA